MLGIMAFDLRAVRAALRYSSKTDAAVTEVRSSSVTAATCAKPASPAPSHSTISHLLRKPVYERRSHTLDIEEKSAGSPCQANYRGAS